MSRLFDHPEGEALLLAMEEMLREERDEEFEACFEAMNVKSQLYTIDWYRDVEKLLIDRFYARRWQGQVAHLFHVDRRISHAWDIRGAARAHHTDPDDLATFHELMDDTLWRGVESYEKRPHPASARNLLILYMVTTSDIEPCIDVFNDAIARFPGDYDILDTMINYATNPKWSGLDLTTWRHFAEELLDAHMRDHPLTIVPYMEYYTELLYIHGVPERELKKQLLPTLLASIRSIDLARECICQAEQVMVYNRMCFFAALIGNRRLARASLKGAKGRVVSYVWRYYYDDADEVRQYINRRWWDIFDLSDRF